MELDKRDKFLFHLYDKLWDSIERSETGVWQFIGFNAALFGIIVLVFTEKLPVDVAGIFGMIIAFWGMNVSINSGWWFNHNLTIVKNIEQQFLYSDDFSRILPSSYKERKPGSMNLLNKIHFYAFFAVSFGVLYFTWSYITFCLFVVGTIVSFYHYRKSYMSIVELIKQTDPNLPKGLS